MAFQLSPGVNVTEIDLTTVVPAVATTTGAIAGDYFYYIANAQLTKIDQDGKLFPRDQLNPVKILRVNLENK